MKAKYAVAVSSCLLVSLVSATAWESRDTIAPQAGFRIAHHFTGSPSGAAGPLGGQIQSGGAPRDGASMIAVRVIGATPSQRFGQSDRETWQPPEKIMDAVGVRPGMRIGEAGAGRGYFTFPLARRVGPEGVVYANDISTSSLDVIRERAGRESLENIKIVVGAVEDPLFPEKNLDMIVMVYVLHELERPVPFLKNVRSYLKPGGLLVIIEGNKTTQRAHFPPFMSDRQVFETVGKTGFVLDRTETFLTRDTVYIYKTPMTSGPGSR
jgi:2-polyprenyl-3-methyl-5-hydroxy-6-metoxy-1,4-benzoquinol methylase